MKCDNEFIANVGIWLGLVTGICVNCVMVCTCWMISEIFRLRFIYCKYPANLLLPLRPCDASTGTAGSHKWCGSG